MNTGRGFRDSERPSVRKGRVFHHHHVPEGLGVFPVL